MLSPFHKKSKLIVYYCLPKVTHQSGEQLFLFFLSQIQVGTYEVIGIRAFYSRVANKIKAKKGKNI